MQGAVEDFAQELALVIRRFLKLKAWRDTEKIVVGGGFRASRIGELTIGRAAVILKSEKVVIDLVPIRNHPDEAGLIGAVHLAPRWMFEAHDAIIGVDIGGTNVRAGIVELNLKKASDLSKARVWKFELWRHADEKSVTREETVKELIDMLSRLIARADKEDLRLAPFIGIGCPGVIEADGTIDARSAEFAGKLGEQDFHLPRELHSAIPTIGEHDTMIVMHNDAVVQGLSEAPFMRDVTHWGVLTIGTGLGNGASPIERRPARIDAPSEAATIANQKPPPGGSGLKPAPFAYAKARSVAHAIELLGTEDARLLAGGQSLIATLNMRLQRARAAGRYQRHRRTRPGHVAKRPRRDRRARALRAGRTLRRDRTGSATHRVGPASYRPPCHPQPRHRRRLARLR